VLDNVATPVVRENAWPEWLRLQPGLTPIHTSPPTAGLRAVALLGRALGVPNHTLKFYQRQGSRGKATRYSATFTLPEFRTLCVKLNDVLQRRPNLGEDRARGGSA
jgi:hypothetical protein